MKTKFKSRQGNQSIAPGIVIGVILGAAVSVICIGILALSIIKEQLRPDTAQYLIPCIQFISAFLGAIIAGKIVSERKGLSCILTGVIYLLLLLGITILLFNGSFQKMWLGIIAITVGCGTAVLVNELWRSRSKTRRIGGYSC